MKVNKILLLIFLFFFLLSKADAAEYGIEDANLTQIETKVTPYSRTVKVYADGRGGCPGGSGNAKVNVEINQTGLLKYSLSSVNIFAGGGVGISANYINKLSWKTTGISCPLIKINVPKQHKSCTTKCTGTGENRTCRRSCRYWWECDGVDRVYSPDCVGDELSSSKFFTIVNSIKGNYQELSTNNNANVKFNNNEIYNKEEKSKVEICAINTSNNSSGSKYFSYSSSDCVSGNINSWGYKVTSGNVRSAESLGVLQTTYKMNLYDAYIDRKTGDIKYLPTDSSPTNVSNYIKEGGKKFIDMDYTSDKLKIYTKLNNLSVINGVSWNSSFTADINVLHKFYKVKSGKINGYAFKYRSVDQSNVFPNKNAGDNWIEHIRNLAVYKTFPYYSYIANNSRDVTEYLVDKDNDDTVISFKESDIPEYSIVLTDGENGTINSIKKYNNNRSYNDNVENSGKSENFVKRFFDTGNNNTNNFNKLGCGIRYNGVNVQGDCPDNIQNNIEGDTP